MPDHTIEAGETLSSIAALHGLSSEKVIIGAPENRDRLKHRPDPHTLYPGETVFIPENASEGSGVRTGSISRLVVELKRLRVVMLDAAGQPLAATEAHVELEHNEPIDIQTDDAGQLEVPVRGHPQSGTIVVGDQSWELSIGHLPPMAETPDSGVSGAQKRLINLGYAIGEADGELGPLTRAALRAFQREYGLEVHGQLDDSTLTTLLDTHGQ